MTIQTYDFQSMTFDDFMRIATPSRTIVVAPKKGEIYRCSRCSSTYLVERATGKDISLYCLTSSRRSNTISTFDKDKNDSHDFTRVEEKQLSDRELKALKAYRSRNCKK